MYTEGPLEAGTIEYGTILKNNLVLYRLCQSVEDYGKGSEQKYADAKLYASAPALLESLKNMYSLARLKFGNLDPDANILFERAEAVLKQAEGE